MLTGDPHQGNTVLQMRAQELPEGQRLASLGPGLGRQPHMRISGTTGIECHMRSITPMAGGALANTSPFHNLGSGTGLPARSARPRNHPQAGPEIVPHDAFHNGRTEPAPVRQPPGPGAPYRVPPGRAGARPRAARKKRPAGWSPFAGIARIRSLGSPFSLSAVPASQPSRRDSGYPAVGAVQLPRSPRRQCSSCAAPMTGAQGRKPRHARANVMVLAQVKAAWDQWAACPGSLPWQATAMLTARYPPAALRSCVHGMRTPNSCGNDTDGKCPRTIVYDTRPYSTTTWTAGPATGWASPKPGKMIRRIATRAALGGRVRAGLPGMSVAPPNVNLVH